MKYLKKKKMYEISRLFIQNKIDELSFLTDCEFTKCVHSYYSFNRGYERLEFGIYDNTNDIMYVLHFSSFNGCFWFRIYKQAEDSINDKEIYYFVCDLSELEQILGKEV